MNSLETLGATGNPLAALQNVPLALEVAALKSQQSAMKAEGEALLALLDPNAGKNLNVSA